jgi:hypothetical protein
MAFMLQMTCKGAKPEKYNCQFSGNENLFIPVGMMYRNRSQN